LQYSVELEGGSGREEDDEEEAEEAEDAESKKHTGTYKPMQNNRI
jgi:hypothetical protein